MMNIFTEGNMSTFKRSSASAAVLLAALAVPARVDILRTLGTGEACVCHLEATLRLRQALLSQHLMALRRAGVIDFRRDGRFIYYRSADRRVLELIRTAAALSGSGGEAPPDASRAAAACRCPKCRGAKPAPSAPPSSKRKEGGRARRDPLTGVTP